MANLSIKHVPELNNAPTGKFIQMYVDIKGVLHPILRFSSERQVRHGELLKKTLEEFGLPIVPAREDHLRLNGFPAAKTDRYHLSGAGRCEIFNGQFTAFGLSSDYEVMPDEKHFRLLQDLYSGLKVRIDPTRVS